MLRAETAAAMLKSAGERISDSLLVALVLKGLPGEYKPFITVTTQKKGPEDFITFQAPLHSYKQTRKCCDEENTENVMYVNKGWKKNMKCCWCGQYGHIKSEFCHKRDPTKEKKRHWCEFCCNSTYDTKFCCKKPKDTCKSVICEDDHTFTFKVAFEQDNQRSIAIAEVIYS